MPSRRPAEDDVRVLLVEDHVVVRELMAAAFDREPGFAVVGQAGSLAQAREMLDRVDVAVVDLGLPDGFGADVIPELHRVSRRAQALVLTATMSHAETARAVDRGAAGVLDKLSSFDQVLEAVRRLRAGEALLPAEEIAQLRRLAAHERDRDRLGEQAIAQLTPREREVLELLAEGLDSQMMADRLHISLRTQRNHMNNILAKLGVHSRLQALVFAARHGLVTIEERRPGPGDAAP
jgi:DNA-binding NarL/FixJ family response regulator